MNAKRKEHSVDTLFSLLLFAMFGILLMMLLLFSARMYRESVDGLNENQNLHMAVSYLTNKFRQADREDFVSVTEFSGLPALCLMESKDSPFRTYIYLQDGILRELFTGEEYSVSPDMGTPIASLTEFGIETEENGCYYFSMKDEKGAGQKFCLHLGTSF